MTDPTELGVTLASIATALDALGVRWAVGGSLASAAHGEPRATNDVDIIASLDELGARRFCGLLGADFYADADMASNAARARSSFNVIDQRSFLKVDVFVPPAGPLGMGQLDRRRFVDVLSGMAAFPILGPEDVVLQKLRWYLAGGEVSDRQWRDLVSVLRHGGASLDQSYLDEVAGPAGLGPLLARARTDASA
jgi:hypothetical protein